MNITKRILIAAVLFIGFSTQASELTPVLQKHLTRDTAGIVEEYFWDGNIKLDTRYPIGKSLGWLTTNELHRCDRIFGSQLDHVDIAPVTYTIPEQHILKVDVLAPIVLRSHITGKIVGNRIIVSDSKGKQYDFKLIEDRKANLERINRGGFKILPQALITRGFIGTHAQMERFMANLGFFTFKEHDVNQLHQQEPATLSDHDKWVLKNWNSQINWVVHGKAKEESTT